MSLSDFEGGNTLCPFIWFFMLLVPLLYVMWALQASMLHIATSRTPVESFPLVKWSHTHDRLENNLLEQGETNLVHHSVHV